MNMDYSQDSQEFWTSLYQSLGDSDRKDDLCPEIRSPIMAMPISMSIEVPAEPWKVLEDGHKEAGPENAAAEIGAKNINEVGEKYKEKAMEKGKEKEEAAKEETKSLGKRPPRGNYSASRNSNEKRRRTGIRTKIETPEELTHCNGKRDLVSTLDCIVDTIRKMKHYVETYCIGPMMPLGMGMDFPGPWMYPYVPPHFMIPYNSFAHGELARGYGNQAVSVTTKGVNDQPQTSKPM